MTRQIVENLELFSEAQLEALEFLPEELENIESELYPNLESISLEEVAKDLEAYFEGDIEEAGLEGKATRRGIALGRTPSKKSATGQQVLKRWERQGKAKWVGADPKNYAKPNGWEVSVKTRSDSSQRQWKPLDDRIHMGHKVGAVTFWEKGVPQSHIRKKQKYKGRYGKYRTPAYQRGFKSKYAREFMLDPSNYRFELGSVNSSAGAREKGRYKKLPRGVTSWPT